MDIDVVESGWVLRRSAICSGGIKTTYRDVDKAIWDSNWASKRDGQQTVHLVRAPKQPPPHISLEVVQSLLLRISFIVEPQVDAGSASETNEKPDRAFLGIEKRVPYEQEDRLQTDWSKVSLHSRCEAELTICLLLKHCI